MAQGPRYHTQFRRRTEGKTDFRRRLGLLKSRQARIVVRKKLNNVIVQVVDYSPQGDRVLAQAEARELATLGWTSSLKNTPAAYLTGLLAGKRAAAKGVKSGVLDIGRQMPSKGGKLFASLQGVIDAGIEVPAGDEMIPDKERLQGEHIESLAADTFATVKSKIESGAANATTKPPAKSGKKTGGA